MKDHLKVKQMKVIFAKAELAHMSNEMLDNWMEHFDSYEAIIEALKREYELISYNNRN